MANKNKRKPKTQIWFNTKYKKNQKIFCKKSLIWNNQILFYKGREYFIDHIEYSRCGGKITTYRPVYFLNKEHYFNSDETFSSNEETYGAEGVSGYGKIDEYFSEPLYRKEKLERLNSICSFEPLT